ncbi:ABC transporter permease [Tomitella biformata]|uniref:ABC transporter permease n=1 Tax=Tomitella biformata TaxID=630403 RepID=UPI000464392F|nr:ABC transporter permease [Tomitella biformata]
MSVLAAERIKLTSTRSPWWCSFAIAALGLGIAVLMALLGRSNLDTGDPANQFLLTPDVAVSGISQFGILVVMIMAALAVTTEYRFGVIRSTFQAVPNRSLVIGAKALNLAVLAAVLIGVVTFGAYYLAKAIAGTGPLIHMDITSADQWRAIYGLVIYAVLAAVLAVAVGALLRQSAGAIALLVLWPLVIESIIGVMGSIGRDIYVFLPFANMLHFISLQSTGFDFHWGPWGGLAYFAGFVAVVLGLSMVVVNKRDA